MRWMTTCRGASGPVIIAVLLCGCAVRTPSRSIDPNKVVDLSYSFDPDTIYWPTAESFTLERVHYGPTAQGYWYAANNICMAEHGGTHMDAPIHFAEGKRTASRYRYVRASARRRRRRTATSCSRPRLSPQRRRPAPVGSGATGTLPAGAIVIMYSGWGQHWGDKLRTWNRQEG